MSHVGGRKGGVRSDLDVLCWTVTIGALAVSGLTAQTAGPGNPVRSGLSPDPLPVQVALALRGHNGRSPINFSPDGAWIAHTVETDETVPRGSSYAYSDTGFPFAEGNSRMQATLSAVDGSEEIALGDEGSSSWGAVWSPDGRRVAFYSDEGGEAGLWVWDRETRSARRITDAIARPFFGFESPRWASDGERVMVKLLPLGTSLAELNSLLPAPGAESELGDTTSTDGPAVTVRRTAAAEAEWGSGGDSGGPTDGADALSRRITGFSVDLAIVDVATGEVQRIVRETAVRTYAFSPRDDLVAYTVFIGA